jgi:iron complex transport system ATP-binding protein
MRLETKHISIGYSKPDIEIASAVDIRIKSPGLTAVIGINGSGKSTLIKSLCGLLPLKKGEIYLYDQLINNYNPKDLAQKLSLVLTKQPIPQNISVMDFVSLGRQPYTNWLGINKRHDKTQIIKSLKQVDLYQLKDKACMSLSDGQLQKVLIARAIAQDTELIILDEPTSHLDMYHKAVVLRLLKKISDNDNKSVIFATHEINLALQLCDSLILIKDKTVVQDTPNSLIKNGKLTELFPKDLVRFDKESKIFKMI